MNYKELLYIDIETAGKYPDLESLKTNDIRGYDLFIRKLDRKGVQFTDWKTDANEVYQNKVSLIPEFGRIVCVSIAMIKDDKVQMMSACEENEELLIKKVHKTLINISNKTLLNICGFYIRGFDIPWLNRKFLEYGLDIPRLLSTFNVKPWEMKIMDLSEVWKNNGTLESVSFDEMLYVLGIESPKSVIAGKDVHKCFWIDKDLNKIKTYCEADVMSCIKAAKKIIHLV